MIEFGSTLRAAREKKGLSHADIAAKTHMMVQQIADLENEDFSRIAAPIYGRGFVKLYCEQVDLDPQPLIAEYMNIVKGKREPAPRSRQAVPPPAPPPPPVQEPQPVLPEEAPAELAKEPEPTVSALSPEPESKDGAEQSLPPQEEPAPEPDAEPEQQQKPDTMPSDDPVPADDFRLESQIIPEPPPSAFDDISEIEEPKKEAQGGPDVFRPSSASRSGLRPPAPIASLGRRFGFSWETAIRISALAVGAILLLWLLHACVSSLYRLATTAPEKPAPSAVQSGATGAETPRREPLKVPALYID